eukprot:COSAG04_NODE_19995_length_403_cov_0.796053_1_plen_103_part_10
MTLDSRSKSLQLGVRLHISAGRVDSFFVLVLGFLWGKRAFLVVGHHPNRCYDEDENEHDDAATSTTVTRGAWLGCAINLVRKGRRRIFRPGAVLPRSRLHPRG